MFNIGTHNVGINAFGLAAGSYQVQIQSGLQMQMLPITLVK
jgi:hypothetical protein